MELLDSLLHFEGKNKLVVLPFSASVIETNGNYPAAYLLKNRDGAFYVGSTGNIKNRINQHRFYLRNGKHVNKYLQDMYDNTTEDKLIFHIYPCERKTQAVAIEKSFLNANYSSTKCLNIGSTLKELDSPRIEKIRVWAKTPEAKKARSLIIKERWQREEFRDKVIRKIGEGIIVDGSAYRSVREASRSTGYCISALRNSLKDGIINTGDIRPYKRKVSAMGVIYDSLTLAGEAHGIRDNTMHFRVNSNSPKWKDFFYVYP